MPVAHCLRPDNVYELEHFLKMAVKVAPDFCRQSPFADVCAFERRGGRAEMYVISGLGSRVKKLCDQAWELAPPVVQQLWLHGQWVACRDRMEQILYGLKSLGLATDDWQRALFDTPHFQMLAAIASHPGNAAAVEQLQAVVAAEMDSEDAGEDEDEDDPVNSQESNDHEVPRLPADGVGVPGQPGTP